MIEFSRPVALDRIGAARAEYGVEARPDELAAIAERLMIPAVARLACRFGLRRAEAGLIEAEGQLEAAVTQVCVVTLEEFAQSVTEVFAVQFVPAGSESDDPDPDLPDQIPYTGNAIDLGEAATEQLALALDPYPKSPAAAALNLDPAEPTGPFAGLAALRDKQ